MPACRRGLTTAFAAPRRGEHGFLLLEVLIAAAIAALALGVLLQTALGSIAATRAAGQYRQALALAQSRLALAAAALPPAQEGQDGPYRWRVQARQVAVADPGSRLVDRVRRAGEMRPALYALKVTVSWREAGRTREVELNTERLHFLPAGSLPP